MCRESRSGPYHRLRVQAELIDVTDGLLDAPEGLECSLDQFGPRSSEHGDGDVVWDEPLLDQVFVSDSDEWAMPMSLPVFLRLKGRAQSGWERLLRAV